MSINEHWVGTWASAQQLTEEQNLPPQPGLANNTIRQLVHVSLGGKRLRVRFSNEFGDGPLTITEAHIESKALTFRGNASVTISAGALVISDPLDFEFAPLSDITVTIRFGEVPHAITGHPGSRTTSYLLATNVTTTEVVHWYVLSGIDVLTDRSAGAIVVLGDSITDGRGVTTDANRRWTDNLARRLQSNAATRNVAVLNQGIGGNRVLNHGLGPSALSRLDRDVIAQNGVRWLIVLEGVNDIGTSSDTSNKTAHDLIAAYEQIVIRAHSHGIRVYGATLLPLGGSFYDTPAHEEQRHIVNNWIRTGGVFDGVIDMDAAMRDPEHPLRLKATADSGDHLHPKDEGYRIMADAVDLNLFR